MSEIWIVSVPILLVDVVNPVLLAAIAAALAGKNPLLRSSAVLLGHTLAYFVIGLLAIYGLAEIMAPAFDFVVKAFMEPTTFNFVLGFLIGVLLIGVAIRSGLKKPDVPDGSGSDGGQQAGGLLSSIFLGTTINLVGAPFAVPYFGFINELFRFEVASKVSALVAYNLAYALPFALMPLAFVLIGPPILGVLKTFDRLIQTTGRWLLPLLFGGLGLAFVVDAIKYFVTGTGLI